MREDGKLQTIQAFERDTRPASIGLLIDSSGSMREFPRETVELANVFLDRLPPEDEVFLVKFAESPYLIQDFTKDRADIQAEIPKGTPFGMSALIDAVNAGVSHMEEHAGNPNRALVILTDGLDNQSATEQKALQAFLAQTDVALYAIAIRPQGRDARSFDSRARRLVESLARAGGGVAFASRDLDELKTGTAEIARAIHSQYILGYTPSTPLSGKPRKVSVKVTLKGASVHARPGTRASGLAIQ